MPLITDLHIHSRFSRACSRSLDLPHIEAWCQLKGIDLVATSDFTHPTWFKELTEQLIEVDEGVYEVRDEFREMAADVIVPSSCVRPVRFLCSTEVSLIYKRGDKVRKVHHVILAPNLETVALINVELDKRGNIKSDGRPILGLDSEELLKILLDISPDIQMIPAHVWTPWFAIFGSKSGFDSVEECFGELSDHICALETGLSSDPLMNWRLSQLDKYVLVSSSDAHSPSKLGREATLFDTECTYPAVLNALRHDHSKVLGTIEFFPEEGKYHADGLRAEKLCLEPDETLACDGISPRTGKKITVGVLHRVNKLADRKMGTRPDSARDFWHIIPLVEIVSEILGVGVASKRVQSSYFSLLKKIGPEFYILKDAPIEDLMAVDPRVGEAIARMRDGKVIVQPGYDGEFGVVKLFKPNELRNHGSQAKLF
jgi:DNA helicase II / ATP-dependent DNA helicase PcrA